MKKDRKLSGKDILIIFFSVVALAILIFILMSAGKTQKETEQELATISLSDEGTTEEQTTGIVCNEVNAQGWVELYNSGDSETDLTGAVLKLNGTAAYTFPEESKIKKGGFLVAEIGQNLQQESNNIISLYQSDGIQIFSFMVPVISESQSYGRYVDGGIEIGIMSATKEKSNDDAVKEDSEDLTFSVPSGFYNDSFKLKLSVPEGYSIYYTTDGTSPTTKSTQYVDAISITNRSGSSYVYSKEAFGYSETEDYMPTSIDMGTVVRAIMVDTSGKTIQEKEQTYYVQLAAKSDYQNMPVISIVTDGNNLFDYFSGIYMAGRSHEDSMVKGEDGSRAGNYYNGWKKDAELEYFEAGKSLTYQGKISMQMLIDNTITFKQKSFSVEVESVPGEGSALAKYVDTDTGKLNISTYDTDNTYKTREYLVDKLLSKSAVGAEEVTPCLLFINGEYWGDYMLKEPYNEKYIASHYDVSGDEVQFAGAAGYNEDFLSLYDFVVKEDMSQASNYAQVENRMDMQSFLDFVCTNMYLSNAGFSIYKGTVWKTSQKGTGEYADGKWRWLMGDVSDSMDNTGSDSVTSYTADSFLMPAFAEEPFIQSLLRNENFCTEFSNTMSHLATDTFLPDNVETVITEATSLIEKPAVSTDERFYGNIEKSWYDAEMENISDFFANRMNYILGYTKEVVAAGGNEAVISGLGMSDENSNSAISDSGTEEKDVEKSTADDAAAENTAQN